MNKYDNILLKLKPRKGRAEFETFIHVGFKIKISRLWDQEKFDRKENFDVFVLKLESDNFYYDVEDNQDIMNFLRDFKIEYLMMFDYNKLIKLLNCLEKYDKLSLLL